MNIVFASFAEGVVVTGGKVNLIGVFRNLDSASYPVVFPAFDYVVSLDLSDGSLADGSELTFEITALDGTVVVPALQISVALPSSFEKSSTDLDELNIVVQVDGIQIPEAGQYLAVLREGDTPIHKLALTCRLLTPKVAIEN